MKLFFVLAIVLVCKFVQPTPLWVYEDEKLENDPIIEYEDEHEIEYEDEHEIEYEDEDEKSENDLIPDTDAKENVQEDPSYHHHHQSSLANKKCKDCSTRHHGIAQPRRRRQRLQRRRRGRLQRNRRGRSGSNSRHYQSNPLPCCKPTNRHHGQALHRRRPPATNGKKDEDTENDPMANTEEDEENVQEDPSYGDGTR